MLDVFQKRTRTPKPQDADANAYTDADADAGSGSGSGSGSDQTFRRGLTTKVRLPKAPPPPTTWWTYTYTLTYTLGTAADTLHHVVDQLSRDDDRECTEQRLNKIAGAQLGFQRREPDELPAARWHFT